MKTQERLNSIEASLESLQKQLEETNDLLKVVAIQLIKPFPSILEPIKIRINENNSMASERSNFYDNIPYDYFNEIERPSTIGSIAPSSFNLKDCLTDPLEIIKQENKNGNIN